MFPLPQEMCKKSKYCNKKKTLQWKHLQFEKPINMIYIHHWCYYVNQKYHGLILPTWPSPNVHIYSMSFGNFQPSVTTVRRLIACLPALLFPQCLYPASPLLCYPFLSHLFHTAHYLSSIYLSIFLCLCLTPPCRNKLSAEAQKSRMYRAWMDVG